MPKVNDYEIVAGPAIRARAALAIQTAWRRFRVEKILMKKGISIPHSNIYQVEVSDAIRELARDKREKLDYKLLHTYLDVYTKTKMSQPIRWTLPEGSSEIARRLVSPIHQGRFEDIDFKIPNFSIQLLRALKEGLIDKDAFLTAHFLYDFLLLANNNGIPDNPKDDISIHTLKAVSEGEPYSPLQTHGITTIAKVKIKKLIIDNARVKKPLNYYVVKLPYHQSIAILYDLLKNYKDNLTATQIAMWQKYILQQRGKLNDCKIETYLDAVLHCDKEQNRKRLIDFMIDCEPNWKAYLEEIEYEHNYPQFQNIQKERESANFLARISLSQSSAPELCLSPDFQKDNPYTPLIGVVVCPPTIFNAVLDAVFGSEAIHIVGQIGGGEAVGQSMRMVRAWHDAPSAMYAYQPDSRNKADENVYSLYPSSQLLNSPSRPVEIGIGPLGEVPKTHGNYAYPAVRTLHDYYHAMIATQNTAIVRSMQSLHDDKAGLAVSHTGMSKTIERLVDLEFIKPPLLNHPFVRNDTIKVKAYYQLYALMYCFEKAGFKYYADINETKADDRYLLLFDLHQNPLKWQSLLYNRLPKELFDDYAFDLLISHYSYSKRDLSKRTLLIKFKQLLAENRFDECESILPKKEFTYLDFETEINEIQFLAMALEYKKLVLFLEDYPNFGVISYIISQKLTPMSESDINLLEQLEGIGYKHFFHWTRNSGVFFNRSIRNKLFSNELVRSIKPAFFYHDKNQSSPFKLNNLNGSQLRLLLGQMKKMDDDKKKEEARELDRFNALIEVEKEDDKQRLYRSLYQIFQPLKLDERLLNEDHFFSSEDFTKAFFKDIFAKALPSQLNRIKATIMEHYLIKNFTGACIRDPMIHSRLYLCEITHLSNKIKIDKIGRLSIYGKPLEVLDGSIIKLHLKRHLNELNSLKRLIDQIANCIQHYFTPLKTYYEEMGIKDGIKAFLVDSKLFFPPLTSQEIGKDLSREAANFIDLNRRLIAFSRLVSAKHTPKIKSFFIEAISEILRDKHDVKVNSILIDLIKIDSIANPNHFINIEKGNYIFFKDEDPRTTLQMLLERFSEEQSSNIQTSRP